MALYREEFSVNEYLQALMMAEARRLQAKYPLFGMAPMRLPVHLTGVGSAYISRMDAEIPMSPFSWTMVSVVYEPVFVSFTTADMVRWELDRRPAKNRRALHERAGCQHDGPGFCPYCTILRDWWRPGPLLQAARDNHPGGQARSEALLLRSLKW